MALGWASVLIVPLPLWVHGRCGPSLASLTVGMRETEGTGVIVTTAGALVTATTRTAGALRRAEAGRTAAVAVRAGGSTFILCPSLLSLSAPVRVLALTHDGCVLTVCTGRVHATETVIVIVIAIATAIVTANPRGSEIGTRTGTTTIAGREVIGESAAPEEGAAALSEWMLKARWPGTRTRTSVAEAAAAERDVVSGRRSLPASHAPCHPRLASQSLPFLT